MRTEGINLLFVGLAGFISVAITQLLTINTNKMDGWLITALICFSVVLPFSIFHILTTEEHFRGTKNNGPKQLPKWYIPLSVGTLLGGFFGIAALFFHFGLVFGGILILTSIAVLILLDQFRGNQ